MIESKLFRLLQALSSKELLAFKSYLRSGLAGPARHEQKLLSTLISQKGKLNDPPLSRPELWQKIHPAKTYDDQSLRLLLSSTTKHLHRFLAILALDENPGWEASLTLRKVGTLGLEKDFFQLSRQLGKNLQRQPRPESEFHSYLLEKEQARFLRQSPRKLENNFQRALTAVDRWYLLEKLRLTCAALSNRFVIEQEADLKNVQQIEELFLSQSHLQSPLIQVYYRVMKLLMGQPNESDYQSLKKLLNTHNSNLPKQELSIIYTYIQNFCIRKINQGHPHYLRELFHLYQNLLEIGLLLENGKLSPWHFKNIVALALRLEEYQWSEQFMADYLRLVPPPFRENARSYNLAKWHFSQGDYSNVKKLLNQVEYDDVFYNIDSKTMLLKIYFEEEEDIALEALAHSFLAYLRRNKLVSQDHKTRYINFVKMTLKLSQAWNMDKGQYESFTEKIEHSDHLANKIWLRQALKQKALQT